MSLSRGDGMEMVCTESRGTYVSAIFVLGFENIFKDVQKI